MARKPSRVISVGGGALDDAPAWVRAPLAAGEAVLLSVALVCTPIFLVWLVSPGVTVGGWTAIQLGLAGWILGHGAPVDTAIGSLTLIPLLLSALILLVTTWSAQRLTARLSRRAPARLGWLGGLRRDVAVEGAAFVATYVVLGLLGALAARTPDVGTSLPRTLLGFLVVGLASYVLGLRAEFRGDLPDVAPGWDPRARLPEWARDGVAAGLQALGLLLAAGLVVAVLFVVGRAERVAALYDALAPGALGGAVLTGGQLMYLPDFATWAASWLVGPGFGVGVGSSVSLTQSTPGLLPLVPVLGALPEPGPLPVWTRLGLLIPVGLGVWVERRAARWMGDDVLDRSLAWATACATAGAGGVVVGWLSSGALGSGRLAAVGVPALVFGALLGGELALGAAMAAAVRVTRANRTARLLRVLEDMDASDSSGSAPERVREGAVPSAHAADQDGPGEGAGPPREDAPGAPDHPGPAPGATPGATETRPRLG